MRVIISLGAAWAGGGLRLGGGGEGAGWGGAGVRGEGGIDGELYEWIVHLGVAAGPHPGLYKHYVAQDVLKYVYWESS